MTKRIAISMPDPMFRDLERARRKARKERSVWLQELIAERLKLERHETDVAAYLRGYREFPETEGEIAEAEAWLRTAPVDDEEWPEAPR